MAFLQGATAAICPSAHSAFTSKDMQRLYDCARYVLPVSVLRRHESQSKRLFKAGRERTIFVKTRGSRRDLFSDIAITASSSLTLSHANVGALRACMKVVCDMDARFFAKARYFADAFRYGVKALIDPQYATGMYRIFVMLIAGCQVF